MALLDAQVLDHGKSTSLSAVYTRKIPDIYLPVNPHPAVDDRFGALVRLTVDLTTISPALIEAGQS